MIEVERHESLPSCRAELRQRDPAVEVGVGRNDRFRKVEQAETPCSLVLVVTVAENPGAASMAPPSFSAPVPFARVRSVHHAEARPTDDFRSDDILIMADLVGIDLAIMVFIEKPEKPLGILLHFIESQLGIVVAIGPVKPVGEGVIFTASWAERLAHRADEHPARTTRVMGGS